MIESEMHEMRWDESG